MVGLEGVFRDRLYNIDMITKLFLFAGLHCY